MMAPGFEARLFAGVTGGEYLIMGSSEALSYALAKRGRTVF